VHVALVARVVEVHARELEQIVERGAHAVDVARDDPRHAAPLGLGQLQRREHLRGAAGGPHAVAELVRQRSVEGAQPLVALAQPLRHPLQVLRRRRLLDQRHRVEDAVRADEQLAARALLRDVVDDLAQEREEDPAEDLVLLEHLVGVEALLVPQGAELHGLGHDHGVAGDRPRRILDVVGDAGQQERDVVEQILAGEDAVRLDRDPLGDARQPVRRQLRARLAHAPRERERQRARRVRVRIGRAGHGGGGRDGDRDGRIHASSQAEAGVGQCKRAATSAR
jgi:hypothetical protein